MRAAKQKQSAAGSLRSGDAKAFLSSFSVIAATVVATLLLTSTNHQRHSSALVDAFHLSFGSRLQASIKNDRRQPHSSSQMQLNPASSLIRPIECRNANNHSEAGICMFSIDCMQNKGTPLSICKHNYFVGTCCRLPEANNFVGIVSDLRETETVGYAQTLANDQLLAGRQDLQASLEQHIEKTRPSVQASTTVARELEAQPNEQHHSTEQTFAIHSQADLSTTRTFDDRLSSITLGQKDRQPGQSSTLPSSTPERLAEQKYMISSTSLFPSAQQTAASSTTYRPAPSDQTSALESARNADGSLPQQASLQTIRPTVLVPSESSALQNAGAIAYELVRDELGLQNHTSLEQQTVLSSAHSVPSSNQEQQQQAYLEESSNNQHKVSIVFSNNHGPSTSISEAPKVAVSQTMSSQAHTTISAQSAVGDGSQEFALIASSSAPGEHPVSTSNSAAATSPSRATQTTSTTTTQPSPTTTERSILLSSPAEPQQQQQQQLQQQQPIGSPLYDLISAQTTNGSSQASGSTVQQTTTPFTSSLSTALLPNVSSHPYAPTTPSPLGLMGSMTTTTLVSHHHHHQAHMSSSSSPSTSRSPILFASTEQANKAQVQSVHLYSNQHSSNKPPTSGSVLFAGSSGAVPPLLVSSKIVSGTGSGSSLPSNNLIPGLSGLQSAILSHIPFKIASGISSGLTSYLQAAMKPSGAALSSSRPLISSNTAPALQYQSTSTKAPALSTSSNSSSSTTSGHASKVSATANEQTGASGSSAQQSPASPPGGPGRDILREAQQVCGRPQVAPLGDFIKKRVARIVGGNQSLFGQWPWMVSLRQWRKGAFLHKCGAALLNEHWAITAAHCVENVKPGDLLLRLGEFDVSNQNEPFPYIERRVKSVVAHPSFDPKTFEYDLALLRFVEPIIFERNIIPVCVPNGNDSYVDRIATVIGWGRLYEDGPLPDIIQHVDVPIIANDECEKMYQNAGYKEEIPEMFICAGINKGGRDSCEGDSGGPLTMVDYDGRSYLVGIISWGIGCALPSQPGVYTRITAFSDWINQIIIT